MIHKNDFDGNIQLGGRRFFDETKRTELAKHVFPYGSFYDRIDGHLVPKATYFEALTACPMCGGDDIGELLTGNEITVFRCGRCGFGFQNPRFRAEFLGELYAGEYRMNDAYRSDAQRRLDAAKFGYGIQEARRYRRDIASVLDVGAGTGQFLEVARDLGIPRCYGMEPGAALRDSRLGFEIFNEFLEEIPPQLSDLSLITLWDTLEHIHDFNRIIASAKRALAPDGLVLIMVPNLNSLASRLIRDKSWTFDLTHLSYFTSNSLGMLLSKHGLDVVHRETVISEIDNCRNYLEFNEPYTSVPSGDEAFAWLTPSHIHGHMLGSRLLFIARNG